MIEIIDAVKEYGGRRVLDGVNLSVAKGEFCVLLGSSGSGKSTLLKTINRLVALSHGTIRIDGQDTSQLAPELLRRRIGYAIQSIGLFPHWSVADNIASVPRLLRWPAARIQARVDELLTLLQLDPAIYRQQYPHQLSGGQQQRVGVARALAADPELLLMDEPFGALDPITRDALQAALAGIQRSTGKTIVFVTHDIDEALRLADRIAILDQGRLIQHASPVELLQQPANDFVRDFVGRNDAGLKLLSLRTVAERLRLDAPAGGEAVPGIGPDSSQREALARMITAGTDRLRVQTDDGRPLGTIWLADLIGKQASP